MSAQVLHTKLYAPRVRPGVVRRPRLTQRLDDGARGSLVLVSAPAGFGKTTAICEWLEACRHMEPSLCSAWLTLDAADGDLPRFLTYLIAAARTAATHVGEGALARLLSSQPPPAEAVLGSLLNDIANLPNSVLLVLDDFHVLDSPAVDHAVAFMIEHAPPQLRLLIAGREDPRLPLARWRARGVVTELRAADLRFTLSEASQFLTQTMHLDLHEADVATLADRTEGWITGLQLAALGLRGRPDSEDFLRGFAGSQRFVLDYLLEEVLQRQPEAERGFLLQTAVLDRLTGDLCDAVTQQPECGRMLEHLERSNLFVVPLDDRRHWYRYHQLFADVLRVRLQAELPDRVAALHGRASAWFERNGMRFDAVRHALSAIDLDRAADLLERAGLAVEESSQAATWFGLAATLPDGLIRARPGLAVYYAHALLGQGDLESAETYLADAERLGGAPSLAAQPPARSGTPDGGGPDAVPAAVAVARAYIAQARGDAAGTVAHARRVLELVPQGEHLRRDQATALLGMTSLAGGDLESADRIFSDYSRRLFAAGNVSDAISTACLLADVRPILGHLRRAAETLEQLHRAVLDQGASPPETADLYRAWGELDLARGDVSAAAEHLTQSARLGELGELPVWRYRWRVATATLARAQGDLRGALDALEQAERLFIRTPMPDLWPVGSLRARVWVSQGRLADARSWVDERGLTVDDDLDFVREHEHLTLARVLLADQSHGGEIGRVDEGLGLLDRLHQAAEAGGRTGRVVEILALQATAHHARGSAAMALSALERAVTMAEPEGYVQVFLDEGPLMSHLLSEAVARRVATGAVTRLLAANSRVTAARHRSSAAGVPALQPLSGREVEVLRYIAAGFSNQQIASRLFLSLYTVKAHARTIYDKLDAHSRTAAVAKARRLGILPHE